MTTLPPASPPTSPPRDPPPDPPRDPPHRHRRRSRARRVLTWIALGTAVLLVLVTVGGWLAYRYFDRRIDRVHLTLPAAGRPPVPPQGVQNYLLVGSDDRAGTNGKYGNFPGQRNDTTILVQLARDGSATVLSFPRDMYVPIPAYRGTDGVPHPATRDRLNAAIAYGGPSLLVRTIEGLTGLRVQHYLSVDLVGFKAMTNAIGGVDVCVAPLPAAARAEGYDNLYDHDTGWRGHDGINHLDGEMALAFVRTRKSLPGGDLDRVKRQQQFLAAVFTKATRAGMLADPLSVERLLRAFTGSLTMDDDTSLGDLRHLASRLKDLKSSHVHYETVPTRTPGPADGAVLRNGLWEIDGQAVQVYDEAGLNALVAPLRGTGPAAGGTAAGAQGSGGKVPGRSVAVVSDATAPLAAAAATGQDAAPSPDSCVY